MKIKKILNQHRRDFKAVFECEHCGNEEAMGGYDDANYHKNIIPCFECKKCGRTAGDDYRPIETKYAEGVLV